MRILVVAVSLIWIGCGSSSTPKAQSTPKTDPPASTSEPKKTAAQTQAAKAAELDKRQGKACEGVCARISDCGIEDLRKHRPDVLAKPPGAQKLWELRYKTCNTECVRPKLSSRQVRVYETCGKIEKNCPEFFRCMDHATPKKKQ